MTLCFFCQKDCDEMGPLKWVSGEPACSEGCAAAIQATAPEPKVEPVKQPQAQFYVEIDKRTIELPKAVRHYGSGPKGVSDPAKGFIYRQDIDRRKYEK